MILKKQSTEMIEKNEHRLGFRSNIYKIKVAKNKGENEK
jgi:hypothetical protein